jgi:UDP-glucose 4-epimerase
VNTKGTLNLLEILRNRKVERFVYASTFTVYGNPEKMPVTEDCPYQPCSPYDISKLAAENYVNSYHRLHGLKTAVVRFSNAYGPRDPVGCYRSAVSNFVLQILLGVQPTLHFEGKATRDFIYVEDAVQGLLLVASHKDAVGGIFNICSGVGTSVKDVVKMIADIAKVKIEPLLIAASSGYYSSQVFGSYERAKRLLGYEPRIDLTEGLKRTIKWCKENFDEFSQPQPYSYLEGHD